MSLAGRLVFLVLVLPEFAPGEIAEFAFLTTVAGLIAAAVAQGLEHRLPSRIGGDREKAEGFLGVYSDRKSVV